MADKQPKSDEKIERIEESEVRAGVLSLLHVVKVIRDKTGCSEDHAKWILIHAMDDLGWRD